MTLEIVLYLLQLYCVLMHTLRISLNICDNVLLCSKAHEHMHLFDDHHEHQQHDSERHDDHEHDHDDDVDDTLVNEWSDHMDDFIPDM